MAFFGIVSIVSSFAMAADTSRIDQVRKKDAITSVDLEVIDNFVSSAVEELVNTVDFTSVASARSDIVSRVRSSQSAVEGQYRQQFLSSAAEHLKAAFDQAQVISDPEHKAKLMLNLMLVVDGLESIKLVDLSLSLVDSENAAIRYWAVHSVTNSSIVKQLNPDGTNNTALTGLILGRLKTVAAKENSPEITGLIAQFAAEVDTDEARQLLGEIVDGRISKYADWRVDYEILDGGILKLLADEIAGANGAKRAESAARFAQLYSYMIQRYVKGQDVLGNIQKKQLVSVLVETERASLSKLLGVSQQVFKTAVEKGNFSALTAEHNSLLGSQAGVGRLAEKLKFDYGVDAAGGKRIAPLVLSEPVK